jgi:hypothetical protein
VPNYLIDASFYVRASLQYYGFDIAPGFWDTLDDHIASGVIASPESVYQELIDKSDSRLSDWIKSRKDSGLFLPIPEERVQRYYVNISTHVKASYDPATSEMFLSKADAWLIAHALDCGATVVTCEVENPPRGKKAKIPDVCKAFNVPCIGMVRLLVALEFRLKK